MILLDAFCGAGGAAEGYRRRGFRVVGIDVAEQPRYAGHEFIRADALDFLEATCAAGGRLPDGRKVEAVHASPPCQASSALRALHPERDYPELIPPTRDLLQALSIPYVIENVVGAVLLNPIMFCGSAFGLGVRRHRLFEVNFPLMAPGCAHGRQRWAVPVYGHTGAGANRGRERDRGRANDVAEWRQAMGISWMTAEELAQAIPPAFTEHIAEFLLMELAAQGVVSR